MAITIASPSRWKKYSNLILSYGIALACLAWIFHDVGLRDIARRTAGMNWGLAGAAVALDVLSYLFQALRWAELLRPVGQPSFLGLVKAIYAGLFANEVLPLRLGELVRAYLVSRGMAIRLISALPSMAVERLLDAIWLALALGALAFFWPLPGKFAALADVFGISVVILTLAFLLIVIWTPSAATPPAPVSNWPVLNRVGRLVRLLLEETGRIRLNRWLFRAGLFSLLLLVCQAASFWLAIRASGISLTLWAGAVVLLIVRLGTAVPNAPANLGSYQFFCIVGLQLFGIDKPRATGVSFLVFFILTVPLWLLGWVALARSRLSLGDIRKGLTRADAEYRGAAPPA